LETFSSLGRVRLDQKKYREAELTLRDALNVFRKVGTQTWQLYNCQSLLGASLAGQKKYAEAEPLLLSSYEGMLQGQATIPTRERSTLSEAGKRIINLYQDWGKPEEVVKWQSTIQAREAALLR
jgi:hypothetical protein